MKITHITDQNKDQYKELVECGELIIENGVDAVFPNLNKCGYIYLRENAKGGFPVLTSVGSYIYLRENAKGGFPVLTSVGGSIDLGENAKGSFLVLTSVGSYIYLRENAKGSFPVFTSVGSYIDLGENAKGSFPVLTSVGSYIYLRENAKFDHYKTKNLNYKSVDNTMFVIESEKITQGIKILTGYILTKIRDGNLINKPCYVAEKDNLSAHGETVKKAIQDLQFKIESEKYKSDPINEDTLIGVQHYRAITGSCDLGVRAFMDSNGLHYDIIEGKTVEKEKIKAADLLAILEKNNAYGIERFKSLITF